MTEDSIGRLVLTLTVIGIVSALLLSFVYLWTTPHIEQHQARARENAVFTVLPGAEEYREVTRGSQTFYEGLDASGNLVGVALIEQGGGFQGEIRLMIGTDPGEEKIYGIRILEHQETPGLGARITEEGYKSNYRNKPFGEYKVVKRKPTSPLEIEAISGATISSEKVGTIVEKALNKIQKHYGGGNQ